MVMSFEDDDNIYPESTHKNSCSNCGAPLQEGAEFCENCSSQIGINKGQYAQIGDSLGNSTITTQRKQVYEGAIHKCLAVERYSDHLMPFVPIAVSKYGKKKTQRP